MKTNIFRNMGAAALLIISIGGGSVAHAITDPIPQAAGTYTLRFDVSNGDQRAFILRLPVGYNPARAVPYPLVVMFHGNGQSADSFSGQSGMDRMADLADQQGKIVVFAQGTLGTSVVARGTWATVGTVGTADLLYGEELIDELAASPNLNADPARVLAAGFSMGGHFVHALGAGTPATFRAIGVVSGFYGSDTVEPPPPPVGTLLPVFIVHGENDRIVPILGGDPVWFGGLRLSAYDSFGRWLTNDGCTEFIVVSLLPNNTISSTVCQAGIAISKVMFTEVHGLGHLWPVAANGFDASAQLLAFFDAQ
jgi:poly(3-hydroxybutyrate) depolymerase